MVQLVSVDAALPQDMAFAALSLIELSSAQRPLYKEELQAASMAVLGRCHSCVVVPHHPTWQKSEKGSQQ
jgi:hypothetical protein